MSILAQNPDTAASETGAAHDDVADISTAEAHAGLMLTALGLDVSDPGLIATPGRMVRALREMTTPAQFTPTDFEVTAEPGQLVLVRDIRFVSVCEHHVLPFVGVAHVGYVPRYRILGLSKVARVVHHYARRLQVQERLTRQIADWMSGQLDAAGVGVLISAEHTCMTLRGVGAAGSSTKTSALRGLLLDDVAARAEFMSLATGPA
ncbi:GTP cyclohydrolase I [Antribacter gilvus]|uniref:GTP cyclohydrolase I n=1 Tax=Antribacter gilvus TaxID=2304675 RepID=UPI000F76CFBD|nr:GTP cyclohydrolase I [Antribacter gilvus]